jgi:hypothetical protein
MFEFDALLQRLHHLATPTQTPGEFTVYQDNIKPIFDCKTIELEVDCNAVRDDAIPPGTYTVVKRWSKKYEWHFHIKDVPNRDLILIHNANFSRQLLGCVGVGEKHMDIDKDGLIDVTNSKETMKKLLAILPEKFILKVI